MKDHNMSKKYLLINNTLDSLVCAGIDPDLSKIPKEINAKTPEETIFSFLVKYIDIVSPYISSFKAQKAFFDFYSGGHELLISIVDYIHKNYPNLPVLLDCKIGDIDNTMDIYLKNIFNNICADGVLVNPYMGDDIFKICGEYPEKLILPLIKTSNPGSDIIQNSILKNGLHLWEYMLNLAITRWNKSENIIPILSQVPNIKKLKQARDMIPDTTPILFAGIGAQNRDASGISLLLNSTNSGVLVNSSRGLMYPAYNPSICWKDSIKNSVITFQQQLNLFRKTNSKFLILAGVSGSGKTLIINELKKINSRFIYISPDITRPPREGEKDKNYISESELHEKKDQGEYLIVNKINGIFYATPKKKIREVMKQGLYPILDFPIEQIEILSSFCNNQIFTIYISPPSLDVLRVRLESDNRDKNGLRFKNAEKELQLYHSGIFDSKIDVKVVSETGRATEIAELIHQQFQKSLTISHNRNNEINNPQNER